MLPTQFNMENPMDKIKQITIALKPWQTYALIAVAMFLLSYVMGSTMPEHRIRPGSGYEEITFMQLFHAGFSIASGVGCIVFTVMTFENLLYGDKDA
jgi:hypothetical protein